MANPTAPATNAPNQPLRKTPWAWLLATFFGAGNLRPGPGTYGSAAAAIVWFVCMHLGHATPRFQALATLLVAIAVTLIGIPASTIVARESGREDPGHIVLDEVAGQLFALIAIPADWKHLLLAFLLFRLFDIWKPIPIRNLERLPGGLGIMLDDVAAGLFALAANFILPILFIAIRFWTTH